MKLFQLQPPGVLPGYQRTERLIWCGEKVRTAVVSLLPGKQGTLQIIITSSQTWEGVDAGQDTLRDNAALKQPQRLLKRHLFPSLEMFVTGDGTLKTGRDL